MSMVWSCRISIKPFIGAIPHRSRYGPGTRIVINTDAPDRSLIYVKGKNLVEQDCAKRKMVKRRARRS